MQKKTIYITEFDVKRLRELLAAVDRDFAKRNAQYLADLEQELRRARIVAPQEIPPDVITMNSKVRLQDLDSGEEMTYRLVFPDDADIGHNRISILAPIGTALIGYRVGDIIEWEAPAGPMRWEIKEIPYQPEAAGDYHL